jgi:hypothetical protein
MAWLKPRPPETQVAHLAKGAMHAPPGTSVAEAAPSWQVAEKNNRHADPAERERHLLYPAENE